MSNLSIDGINAESMSVAVAQTRFMRVRNAISETHETLASTNCAPRITLARGNSSIPMIMPIPGIIADKACQHRECRGSLSHQDDVEHDGEMTG